MAENARRTLGQSILAEQQKFADAVAVLQQRFDEGMAEIRKGAS